MNKSQKWIRNGSMKIFVDADACPVVRIVEEVAEKYRIDVTLLCDTNHILTSDYSEVIYSGSIYRTVYSKHDCNLCTEWCGREGDKGFLQETV